MILYYFSCHTGQMLHNMERFKVFTIIIGTPGQYPEVRDVLYLCSEN